MRTSYLTGFLAVIAGCSNGSKSPAALPESTIAADVTITESNAIETARAGVRGSFDFTRLAYIGAGFVQTTMPTPTTGPGNPPTNTSNNNIQTVSVAGPAGGSASLSWEDVDEDNAYSSGDIFTINYSDYGDEGMVLNGLMTIDDFNLQGLLPGDGTYILDATLNLIGLDVQLGAATSSFNIELPFRLENRILVEIFDLYLFEDHFFGAFQVLENSRLMRYETDDFVRYSFNGSVFSPELPGIVEFSTPGFFQGSIFLSDPTEGVLLVSGIGGTFVELEPSCIVPGVCFSLDLRVEEDGDDENFEGILTSNWQELLPQ